MTVPPRRRGAREDSSEIRSASAAAAGWAPDTHNVTDLVAATHAVPPKQAAGQSAVDRDARTGRPMMIGEVPAPTACRQCGEHGPDADRGGDARPDPTLITTAAPASSAASSASITDQVRAARLPIGPAAARGRFGRDARTSGVMTSTGWPGRHRVSEFLMARRQGIGCSARRSGRIGHSAVLITRRRPQPVAVCLPFTFVLQRAARDHDARE